MALLFDKFEIIACIKENDYASVYRAKHVFLDTEILLKTLETKSLRDPMLLDRFRKEAKILARLDHPNIIKVMDFGVRDTRFYISFEYFKGINLRHFLDASSGYTITKEQILAQIVDALEYAHSAGVIHRDLKPENILLNASGTVKIADFGLALSGSDPSRADISPVIGTPAYMSPEQTRGESLTGKTDLFSLGIIIFELYTGRNPFLGKDASETLNNILKANPECLLNDAPPTIAPVADALRTLLANSPGKRTATLTGLRSLFPAEKQPTTEEKNSTSPLHRRTSPAWTIAALVVILLLVVVYRYFPGILNIDIEDLPVTDSLYHTDADPSRHSDQSENLKPENRTEPSAADTDTMLSDAGSAPPSDTETGSPVPGTLMVECLPWAYVEVDSLKFDSTPLKDALTLAPGEHRLRLSHPGYPDYNKVITIGPGEETIIKVNLDTLVGYIDCRVHPWGEVYINDEFIGQTPLPGPHRLSTGRHILTIRNPHATELRSEITIVKAETLIYKHDFRKEHATNNGQNK